MISRWSMPDARRPVPPGRSFPLVALPPRGGGRSAHLRGRSIAVLLAAFAALASGCREMARVPGEVGTAAPNYAAVDLAGDTVALAHYAGYPVLLNVWATWCGPCRVETPALQTLHEEYQPHGLRVVGVSIDAAAAKDQVRDFMREYGVTYDILLDPGETIGSTLGIRGVPSTFLIGRDGTILWRHLGPVRADDAELRRRIANALT